MSAPLHPIAATTTAPSHRLRHPLVRALAVSGVVALASCGGGSGGTSGSDTTVTPSDTGTVITPSSSQASDYWVAGLAQSKSTQKAVFVVFDPDQPSRILYTRSLGGPTQAQLWSLSGVDSQSQPTLITPNSAVSFLVSGHVEYMALDRSSTLTPRTLSVATDVCSLMGASRANMGSRTLELSLVQRGPDCAALQFGTYSVMSSSLTPQDAAPKAWTQGMATPLPDADTARYLMLHMDAQSDGSYALQAYDDQGVALSRVTGAANLASGTWGILGSEGATQSTLAYVGAGSQATLRRLSWTSSSAVLGSAVIHSFTTGFAGSATATQGPAQGSLFADGQALYHVAPGATQAELMFTASEAGFTIVPTSQHVVALFQSPGSCPHAGIKCVRMEIVAQAGDTPVSLTLEGTSTTAPTLMRKDGSDDKMVVVTPHTDGTQTLGLLDLQAAASGVSTLIPNVKLLGWVSTYDVVSDIGYHWPAQAALVCQPDTRGLCAGRSLFKVALDGSTIVTLGTLPATFTGNPMWQVYAGHASAIGVPVNASGDEDLYVVKPEQSSSLTLVKAHP